MIETDTEPTEEPTEPELEPEAPEAPIIHTPTEPEAPEIKAPIVATETPAAIITPPFTDWASMGATAIYDSPVKDKVRTVTMWTDAVSEVNHDPRTDNLLNHLIHYCTTKDAALSTRTKLMGSIKGTLKKLGVETNAEYQTVWATLRDQNDASTNCVEVSIKDIKDAFSCTNGALLTTQTLQDTVTSELAKPPTNTLALMVLSFVAFHGNRPQDWCTTRGKSVRYEKANFVEGADYGYYCPESETMHLFEGKNKGRGYITFEVGDCVAQAIALFHSEEKNHTYLLPLPKNGKAASTDLISNTLKKTYFAEGNTFGFPVHVTPTNLRKLYELHIRHVLKLSQTELDRRMKIIGHSNATSIRKYSQTFKKMLEFNQSV